ncbi:MAG: O-antigen ligase domain-containing protein, partial [Bradyrhizobium sp.]|nr:O-antigen ligase domain-containing protein [Bradyrhizobium sp.]
MAEVAAREFVSPTIAPPGVVALQRALVWLVGAAGAIVFIEPSPYELATLASAAVFIATGIRLRLVFLPLLLLLFLINLGYTISAIPLLDDSKIASWIATSWYMAVTAMLLALVTSDDTGARLDMLRRGLVMGGAVAALAGVAGYFHLVPGGYDLLTLYGRARGTFKDPNVLGAFLILPALLALQNVVTARLAATLRAGFALGVMALAILLAFSRAAWGGLVLTSAFMLALMVLTSTSSRERSRIIVMTLAAAVIGLMLIAVLLSLDSVADMF